MPRLPHSEKIPKFDFNIDKAGGISFEITPLAAKAELLKLKQQPRRDNFYVLFWITGGTGVYMIDFQQYPLHAGMLFCIAPGQVHYWHLTSPITGIATLFLPDFLVEQHRTSFPSDFSIFDWNTSAGFPLDATDQAKLETLLSLLHDEYEAVDTFNREDAIRCTLHLLLIHAQRASTLVVTSPPTAGDALLHMYLMLIDKHYLHHKKVQDYA
ncbi:MAG: AraC family ligand binding domain-containing protein, partial [Chloroflexota bacterium]